MTSSGCHLAGYNQLLPVVPLLLACACGALRISASATAASDLRGAATRAGVVPAVADYMADEARYAMLRRSNPERAAQLFALAQADADERWHYYSQLAGVQRALPADHGDAASEAESGPKES